MSVVREQASARIAVAPAWNVDSYARLFAALARTFRVQFMAATPEGHSSCDALISFEGTAAETNSVPTLLVAGSIERSEAEEQLVQFEAARIVPAALRGRRLREAVLRRSRLAAVERNWQVLATVDNDPIWAREPTGRRHVTAIPLIELEADETLRAQLRPGRFMSLLPLVEFLRDVVDDTAWEAPPQRACFVFDDPNLHASRYGFIRFEELSRHATDVGYHAAMAMVPLDGWYASPTAARLFRDDGTLSLTAHGINHIARELDRDEPADRLQRALAQALRRVDRFERRYGIPVSRVMIAPHGTCSTTALDQLLAIGFDAASLEWPYWWLDARQDVLAGWEPADLSISVLPVLPRHHLGRDTDELLLQAYLGQPLIVYGHHEDLADGLAPLERVANLINELATTTWSELRQIGETNYRVRRTDGDGALLQSFSARIRFEVPAEVQRLVLAPPGVWTETTANRWVVDDGSGTFVVGPGEEVPVKPGAFLSIRVAGLGAVDYRAVAVRHAGPWSVGRRALVEARDRLRPRIGTIRSGR